MNLEYVNVSGHNYGIKYDNEGNILETMCEKRWSWTTCPIGDKWLVDVLKKFVEEKLSK